MERTWKRNGWCVEVQKSHACSESSQKMVRSVVCLAPPSTSETTPYTTYFSNQHKPIRGFWHEVSFTNIAHTLPMLTKNCYKRVRKRNNRSFFIACSSQLRGSRILLRTYKGKIMTLMKVSSVTEPESPPTYFYLNSMSFHLAIHFLSLAMS